MKRTVSIQVHDASHVGDARRLALELARAHRFDDAAAGRVAVIVNEMSSNLVKHTRTGGELLLGVGNAGAPPAFEILALDRGPGIVDLHRSLRDGHSTAGTPGTGLGAIDRLSDRFDIHSAPTGTAVFSRVLGSAKGRGADAPLSIAGLSVAMKGEEECGDTWAVSRFPTATRIFVADGLGHGPDAARAANAAAEVFRAQDRTALPELLAQVHDALRATRGAAVGIAEIDVAVDVVRFAGVGNIGATVLYPGSVRKLVSHDGTLGFSMSTVREYAYPFPKSSTLIVHSDGIKTQWALDSYAGLLTRHPALIAGIVYRDFSRPSDDATVVVCARGEA